MVVWGGATPSSTATGVAYDPEGNAWTALPTAGAPAARENHRAVWTGRRMLVWGGATGATTLNTGGIYDWGGHDGTATLNTGARYTPPAPAADTWRPMSRPSTASSTRDETGPGASESERPRGCEAPRIHFAMISR